jgi:hypothetical protein
MNVTPQLVVQGNSFIFVGTDPALLSANKYFATTATPSGGTFSASSSDSSDTFTYGSLSGKPWVAVTTKDQSLNVLDRTLSFKYTLNQQAAFQLNTVTARQFAYSIDNNPSNACSLGHGTDYTYIYTVYTHPDKTAVDINSGLAGTLVIEGFNPSPVPCGTHTGDGALNGNGQFIDHVAYCGTNPLTCSGTTAQSISVGGYGVRNNTLTFSSNGVSAQNNGPTQ